MELEVHLGEGEANLLVRRRVDRGEARGVVRVAGVVADRAALRRARASARCYALLGAPCRASCRHLGGAAPGLGVGGAVDALVVVVVDGAVRVGVDAGRRADAVALDVEVRDEVPVRVETRVIRDT